MDAGDEEHYSRRLDELRADHEPSYGGKSAALGELLAAAVPVPPGFALSASAFNTFVRQAGLTEALTDAVGIVFGDDVAAVKTASRRVAKALGGAPIPDEIGAEIARRYAELGSETGLTSPPVAVRSSAVGEDTKEATFAGQQQSYLWVRGTEQVVEAIRHCWISLYSPEAISYRNRVEAQAGQPAMGVTVQLMVDALVSGVAFTCNPVSGDPSMVAINASWGLGLAVVGGEVTPDDYLVSKVTGELVRASVNRKHIEYVPDADAHGPVRLQVPVERMDAGCLDEPALAAVLDVARRAERHFGCHQDIEWAIARDRSLPDSLFVVQSRPVTAVAKRAQEPPASALSLVMKTFGAR